MPNLIQRPVVMPSSLLQVDRLADRAPPSARFGGACQPAIQALAGPAHAEAPLAGPSPDNDARPERKRDARGGLKSNSAASISHQIVVTCVLTFMWSVSHCLWATFSQRPWH